MTQSSAGAGADASAALSPNTSIQGGTGSLTITVPGCVYIGGPNQSIGPAQGAVPAGSGMPFFGSIAPEGWLLCNGAEVSREDYAALFDVIGTTYGVGNGNTTFQLPDLRGRFPLGLDNMGGTSADVVTAAEADSLAGSGGAETHTLDVAEIPSHSHRMRGVWGQNGSTRGSTTLAEKTHSSWNTRIIENTGGGGAHNNMPPYLSLNYIIKT